MAFQLVTLMTAQTSGGQGMMMNTTPASRDTTDHLPAEDQDEEVTFLVISRTPLQASEEVKRGVKHKLILQHGLEEHQVTEAVPQLRLPTKTAEICQNQAQM